MPLNTQMPEPMVKDQGREIDLHSMFITIQGEGPYTGHLCLFIRLAGCSLMCPHCDTEYTQGRQKLSYDTVAARAAELLADTPAKLIVITGGEPTRQNLSLLVLELMYLTGCQIQIESNGMHPLPGALGRLIMEGKVTWVVSPKTSQVHADTRMAQVFKYVIDADSINPEDGLPLQALGHKAKPHVARPPLGWSGQIYVNPMDAKDPKDNRRHMFMARDSAMKYGYILGVQLHKIVGVD